MPTFLKSLARFLGSSKGSSALYLAAFGKHPGWNDHIDDLGLDTDELVTAKRLLYVQGINQNVDGATWEKLEPSHRVDAFRHNFFWHMPHGGGSDGSLIVGRLWSSVDGKGRDKYPMVLCAQVVNLPDNFAATVVLPSLAATHERCAATTEAGTVRRLMDADRTSLRELIKTPPAATSLSPNMLAQIVSHPDLQANHEGFHRIVYQIARGMNIYRPAALSAARNTNRRPEQIRVPTCGMPSPEALLFWLRFCLTLLDPAVPILLLAPDPALTDLPGAENGWIDIIVGEPTASNLFCMKAKNKTLPLTSDIPYTLDAGFTAAVDKFIDTCAAAAPTAPLPPWPAL